MSLKTRCPACDTVFKIVPDQLKVSSGWVRCGRCAEVFDAASHAVSSEVSDAWQALREPTAISSSLPTSGIATKAASEIAPKNMAINAVNTPATDIFSTKKGVDSNYRTKKTKTAQKEKEIKEEANLTFMRIAKNKAFWQRTTVVRSLRAVCVCLLGLLFFQVVFSQRNHLVASKPALKPSFELLCQALGCTIDAFKNIDAFKIDSSSFQKSQTASPDSPQAEVFALKLSLKNNAELAIAMPAVELTLTDANDKPVLRRVLLAKDFGFNADTLPASGDWNGAMTVALTPSVSMAPITGYRVLLFYP